MADSLRERWLQALSEFHLTGGSANVRALIDSAAADAHNLHQELERGGQHITHKQQLIRNRGVQPTDPEFYRHVHAIEDFLELIGCAADRGGLRRIRKQGE
ncbi:MAG: hypothetical protein NTY19_03440 [Planctomycetota bacterium]|nr:hypothetical protein [Planctomycetota bacterium]